jgi:hypothetical protein
MARWWRHGCPRPTRCVGARRDSASGWPRTPNDKISPDRPCRLLQPRGPLSLVPARARAANCPRFQSCSRARGQLSKVPELLAVGTHRCSSSHPWLPSEKDSTAAPSHREILFNVVLPLRILRKPYPWVRTCWSCPAARVYGGTLPLFRNPAGPACMAALASPPGDLHLHSFVVASLGSLALDHLVW